MIRQQSGQSMTEFVVAAAFVMVPLFLIVPAVGKYIDMKLAAVEAARYSSWEYTANYIDRKDQPGGFKGLRAAQIPQKKAQDVAEESKRRFFSDTSLALSSSSDKTGFDPSRRNPLWTFHNGLPMYNATPGDSLDVSGSNETPDKTGVGKVIAVIGKSTSAFGNVLQAAGLDVGFDAINPDGNFSIDGLYSTSLSIHAEEAPAYKAFNQRNRKPLFGQELDLNMTAKSGLLTESWGAGGKQHTLHQTGGLIPTVLLSGIFQDVLDVVSFMAPSLHSSSLKFGYPVHNPDVMDEVPVGALENDERTLNCRGGYCEQ